jgi:hypothetical protein
MLTGSTSRLRDSEAGRGQVSQSDACNVPHRIDLGDEDTSDDSKDKLKDWSGVRGLAAWDALATLGDVSIHRFSFHCCVVISL